MILLDNQTDLNLNFSTVEAIAHTLSTQEIEVLIVNDETMQSLNCTYRGKTSLTDVLSFPLDHISGTDVIKTLPLGSIVIAASYIQNNANTLGHTQEDELALLFIHGMLHLLGFDHETDDGEMRLREKELIKQFDLPKSLIIRTEEL